MPDGTSIFPSFWQMRRKREVTTGKIKKYDNKRAKLDQNKKRDSNKREGYKVKDGETKNPKKTKAQKPTRMFQKPVDAVLRRGSG